MDKNLCKDPQSKGRTRKLLRNQRRIYGRSLEVCGESVNGSLIGLCCNADTLQDWRRDLLDQAAAAQQEIRQLEHLNVPKHLMAVPDETYQVAIGLIAACEQRISELENGRTDTPRLVSTPFRIPAEDFEPEPPIPAD